VKKSEVGNSTQPVELGVEFVYAEKKCHPISDSTLGSILSPQTRILVIEFEHLGAVPVS
jgi:hypothetical protein